MARPKKSHSPHIFWRKGARVYAEHTPGARAYADLRAYSQVGGGREALNEPGSSWGTTDREIALALFEERIAELNEMRRGRVGHSRQKTIGLAELVRHHLLMKAKAGRTSDSHMYDLEARLRAALEYFGRDRDPGLIVPDDVRDWSEVLAEGGRRKPGTVRHYLNALSGLFGRAQEGLFVRAGYNPVSALQEKPTGRWKGEASFFEVADAALLLEAARILESRPRLNSNPGLHPIIGTFLLTGGRKSEVLGLEVQDVSFDRGIVRFRPNEQRGLKTQTSVRTVPLWPQLRELLQVWMYGGETPRTSGLLFPTTHGGMVRDLRKSLDAMGKLCGMEAGEVRTRAFRHTYCSARLQTVQRIVRPGTDPSDEDAWDYVEVSRFQVQKEMGHGGAQLVDRIYGHAQRRPHRSDLVEYRVENHQDELGERLSALMGRAEFHGPRREPIREGRVTRSPQH